MDEGVVLIRPSLRSFRVYDCKRWREAFSVFVVRKFHPMKSLRIAVGAFFPSTHCQRIAEGVGLEAERLQREQGRPIEVWQFNLYDRFLREREGLEIDGAVVYANYFEVAFGMPHKAWPSFASLGVPWVNTSHRYALETGPLVVQGRPGDWAAGGAFFFSRTRFSRGGFFAVFRMTLPIPGNASEGLLKGGVGIPPTCPRHLSSICMGARAILKRRCGLWPNGSGPYRGGCAIFAVNDEKGGLPSYASRARSAYACRKTWPSSGVDDDPVYTRRSAAPLEFDRSGQPRGRGVCPAGPHPFHRPRMSTAGEDARGRGPRRARAPLDGSDPLWQMELSTHFCGGCGPSGTGVGGGRHGAHRESARAHPHAPFFRAATPGHLAHALPSSVCVSTKRGGSSPRERIPWKRLPMRWGLAM